MRILPFDLRVICSLLSVVFFTVFASADVVTQYSFENNLNDTAASGGTVDNLSVFGGGTETYQAGIVGSAVKIDTIAGAAHRLRATTSADLNLTPNFTLEAYVRPDANNTGEWDRFWTKWGDGGNQWHWAFRYGNNGLDFFENGSQRFDGATNSAVNSVPLDRWSHVAVVGDGSTIKGFIDGTEVVSAAYVAPTSGAGAMSFGNFESPANALQFTGLIDEARIHNTALTAAELNQRAQALIVPNPTAGLLSYYEFEGNGNDTAMNYTQNVGVVADNLSAVGGTVNFVPGIVGQAADLNGGFLTTTHSPDQDLSSVFTIEGWINPDAITGTFQRIAMNWESGDQSYHFGIRGDDVNLFLSTDGSNAIEVATGGSLTAGEWQHIAAVSDGTNVFIYQDGFLVDTGVLPGLLNQSTSDFNLGDILGFEAFRYSGLLDEFAIWNEALTADQIRSHYLAGSQGIGLTAVPEPTSIAIWAIFGALGIVGMRLKRHGKTTRQSDVA